MSVQTKYDSLPLPIQAYIDKAELDKKWLVIFKVKTLTQEIFGERYPSQSHLATTRHMIEKSKSHLPTGWKLKTRIGGLGNVYYLVHPGQYSKEKGHSHILDIPADVINDL